MIHLQLFESFEDKSNFEERIIDTILNTIKDNQVYLTQKNNLSQLAKLGYMYNTLWYAGRASSYDGVIPKGTYINDDEVDENGEFITYKHDQCDENPKYKIEMCEPENDKINNLIYDAWGMHVRNDYGPDWETFSTTVLKGKEMSDHALKLIKPDKNFDEWVEVLTDKEYKYSRVYPDRRSVANHMLCVIGNGYGYRNGVVTNKASGGDQDASDYGDWENAKFRGDIQIIVNKIMNDREAKLVIKYTEELKAKEKAKKDADDFKTFGMSYEDFLKEYENDADDDLESKKYNPYYPISNYSIIHKLDANSDPSYIKAGIEICEEILAHENEESVDNVKFAKKFLTKFK